MLAIDFQPSLALVYGRPPRPEVVAVAEQLRERSGWRVAIADLSRLGSAPSYLFSAVSGREQVFGWAYQGTTTAPTLASINYALSRGFPVYAVDRLDLLGADDVIVLRDPAIPESFRAELEQRGYAPNWSLADLDLYHRDGGPRAFALQLGVLGIGEGTQNLAYLFPDVAVGSSSAVDDYDLAFLRQFRAIVLSRFDWRRRADAEQLIADYVALGGTVVVDLTGAPDDVLARQPKFLGVYAEPLTLYASPTLRRGDERLTLHPFAQGYRPWNTHTPQGLDRVDVTYSHFGAGLDGVVVGSRRVGPARVTFVGMNLIFHALTTGDPTAIAILADALGMRPEVPLRRQVVPLRDYQASQSGYRFHYELATPADLLIPVAHHSGTIVQIDGQPIASRSASRLVLMAAPAGSHLVEISTRPTAIHQAGLLVTLIGALVLLAFLMRPRATGRGGDGARRRARSLALSLTAAIALGLGTLAGLPLDIASAAGITLTPGSGVPGTTVQVDGAGFRGDRDVTITIDGATQPTSPSPCRTSAAGAFQCTFVVPGVAPGGHAVEARTTGQDRANATLTVLAPTSTATPTSVPTATVAPSLTPTSTVSSTSTSTPVPTLTSLPTSTATAASTSAATPTSSPTSAASATVAPSLTPTSTVPSTSTSTPVPTVTPPSTSTPTTAPPTFTSTPGAVIVMDGAFDDWVGRANVADPAGDASSTGDIATLYWGTNPNDATVYWMIERHPGSMSSTQYTVAVDMNNNGVFGETADRQIAVQYEPRNKNSRVDVVVRDGAGASISQSANDDWGESQSEGGRRVEFRASFADLGMGAGQAIRMVATSDAGDRAPDAGDIQWSPAPALGPLLAILVALGCVFAWREQRRREERASSVD
ncbi:MAG: hypothetical protein HYY04_03645 [Chloroflexi bacterium]|nr:hypothetical protein [Chloroflexota bacterium]